MQERQGKKPRYIPKNPRTPFAKFENLSEYIIKRERELGHQPRLEEMNMAAMSAVQVFFGGYTKVKAMMGAPMKYRRDPALSLKNWQMLEKELDNIIKDLGYFPSSSDLRELDRNDVRGAIEQHHGGFPAVREKMGVSQIMLLGERNLSRWENFRAEMLDTSSKLGHFPTMKELWKMGRYDLTTAALKHHEGFVAARSRLGVKAPIRTGPRSLKHFENIKREILDMQRKLGYFPTATDIQSIRMDIATAARVHHGGYKELAAKLGRPVREARVDIKLDKNQEKLISRGLKGRPEDVKALVNHYSPLLKQYVYSISPRHKDALFSRSLEIFESVRKGAQGPIQFAIGFWRALKTELSYEYIRLKTGFKISISDLNKIRFIHRHRVKFNEKHGRMPTAQELEDVTGYKGHELARLLTIYAPLSMDKPVYHDEDSKLTLGDTIGKPDAEGKGPDMLEEIRESGLDKLDQELLIGRFGLDGDAPESFTQLAKTHSLTRPGVKQRINDALARLKKE